MTLTMVSTTLGGLGLFLLGMQLLTEGLKALAGSRLHEWLQRAAHSDQRAILSGTLITALVQSSSAVTVATLGFVNAGLLSLRQAIAIVFGCNLGTTMTGWMVALLGLKLDIGALALPMIGLGMLAQLLPRPLLQASGQSLSGLGLFFLGINLLKDGLAGWNAGLILPGQDLPLLGQLLLLIGVGTLLTAIMQSSSAVLALVLSATVSLNLPLSLAAALVIGANLGTTSTAILAVIGATANAKRVAAAHILFNLLTAAVGLLLLLGLHPALSQWQSQEPASVLAAFHTGFNLLGILLLWPLLTRLTLWLQTRFQQQEHQPSQPQYVDTTLLATPALALEALDLELARLGSLSLQQAQAALSSESGPDRLQQEWETLQQHLDQHITELGRQPLSVEQGQRLSLLLRISHYYQDVRHQANTLATQLQARPLPTASALSQRLLQLQQDGVALLELARPHGRYFCDPAALEHSLQRLQQGYQQSKQLLFEAGSQGQLPLQEMLAWLDIGGRLEHLAELAVKAHRHRASLFVTTDQSHAGAA
ncbi:Na/Pi cotransporter family protein [Balneatrix alpica]|uniref:Na/Pi cotransporter family protein n=1 Tax=Balneatrix alpica TaxID=75684 RepID=A0ABV5ZBA3_9GAMM|nr:Na/Pi symporter [Balneatrix alpica]